MSESGLIDTLFSSPHHLSRRITAIVPKHFPVGDSKHTILAVYLLSSAHEAIPLDLAA